MQFRTETHYGEKNLIWCMERYTDSSVKEGREYAAILKAIYPDIPARSYTGTNLMNLKVLFMRIQRENSVSNAEFHSVYVPLITEPLEHCMKDEYGMDSALWGAWYLAEAAEDPYGGIYSRVFDEYERRQLGRTLLDPSADGEAIGYALCVFAGLTALDAMNARYRDLREMRDHFGIGLLHLRGTFPKRADRLTSYEISPRYAVLPGRLYQELLDRKAYIEESIEFPVETDEGVFHNAGDLPIACRGTDKTRFSRISSLDAYATGLLREDLAFDEMRAAYISKDLLSDPARYAAERSAAYSTGRLDYGACLHAAGIDTAVSSYLLGHSLGEEDKRFTDINEETQLFDAYIDINRYYNSYLKD